MSRENGKKQRDSGAIPPAEWAVAALGALLVCAAVGILIWEGFYGSQAPPDITLRVENIQAVSAGYLVKVLAINRGGSTAASLQIRGTLMDGKGGTRESSEAKLDYLPGQSHGRLGLYFRSDPRQGQLLLYATGFQEP
jgi:uncharacterized protein (TIGR02588 family)